MDRLDRFRIFKSDNSRITHVVRGAQAALSAYWKVERGAHELTTSVQSFGELKLRSDALAFYMAVMAQGPVEQRIVSETLFESVSKTPAAHTTSFGFESESVITTPIPTYSRVEPGLSEPVLASRLKEALLETALEITREHDNIWLEASGGIDSTLMGGLAKRVKPKGRAINAVTLVYPYYEFRRESRFADIAVASLGANHVRLDGASCLSFSDLALEHPTSEPSLVLAGLGQHRKVFGAVQGQAALLLNGNGGDSLFALGPERQLRYQTPPRQLDWMSPEFFAAFSAHLAKLRDHFSDGSGSEFLTGGNLDDRWIEREILPSSDITRTHLFMDPAVPALVAALWERVERPEHGKWILKRHFSELIPQEILHRPGKVAYNGIYVRAYRAAIAKLTSMVESYSDHLRETGISPDALKNHMLQLGKGKLDGDLEVSVVITYLMWLEGWKCSGKPLL